MSNIQTTQMRINCPHCTRRATIRTSKEMSPISREVYLQCTNYECGHTWVSLFSAIRTISPSQLQNPNVYIPHSDKPHVPAAMTTSRNSE